MPISTISTFLQGFKGGARSNRFYITTDNCGAAGSKLDANALKFHVRAASVPGAAVRPIGLNWFGRTVNIPGERIITPWQVTVLDDRGSKSLYNTFKAWQKELASYTDELKFNIDSIKACKMTVQHLKTNTDEVNKTFNLFQVWPVDVGPFVLDMNQDNVLSSFTVTLSYTHFTYNHT